MWDCFMVSSPSYILASLEGAMHLTDHSLPLPMRSRNLACIGCGCPRSGNGPISPHFHNVQQTRILSSPRFINSSNYQNAIHQFPHIVAQPSPVPSSSTHPNPFQAAIPPPPAVKTPPSHLLLTPSGRAFAVGGKVQNVSTDPLAPCVMYWPDNEALPEQGQIRPTGLVGIPVRSDPYPENLYSRPTMTHVF
jgi:hypothetical protein